MPTKPHNTDPLPSGPLVTIVALVSFIIVALILSCLGCATVDTNCKRAESLDYSAPNLPPLGSTPQQMHTQSSPRGTNPTIRWRLSEWRRNPPTGSQVFAQTVGKFSALAVILIAALCFLAPGTVAAVAIRQYARFRTALRQTVSGIESVNAVQRDPQLHDSLKATQSSTTQRIIQAIRRD